MVDLMAKKNIFFILSILIFLTGIVATFVNGVKLDIQFQGGTIMQIQMPSDKFDTEKAAAIVQDTIGKRASVQKSTTYNPEDPSKNITLMVLNIGSNETLNDNEQTTLIAALRKEYNIPTDAQVMVNSVAPFIGDEIKTNAMYAIILSAIMITLYVWYRFRVMHRLSAGVFAVLALVHDCFVMYAVYVLFRIPINDSFVAAVLTIIGYSINDTVVIYDRIRENTRILRKMPVHELVNKSVMQTLARSINTSVCTLISVIVLYVFAAYFNIQSLKDFSFPLVVLGRAPRGGSIRRPHRRAARPNRGQRREQRLYLPGLPDRFNRKAHQRQL
jgi:preprotein translocase subunit SecF